MTHPTISFQVGDIVRLWHSNDLYVVHGFCSTSSGCRDLLLIDHTAPPMAGYFIGVHLSHVHFVRRNANPPKPKRIGNITEHVEAIGEVISNVSARVFCE